MTKLSAPDKLVYEKYFKKKTGYWWEIAVFEHGTAYRMHRVNKKTGRKELEGTSSSAGHYADGTPVVRTKEEVLEEYRSQRDEILREGYVLMGKPVYVDADDAAPRSKKAKAKVVKETRLAGTPAKWTDLKKKIVLVGKAKPVAEKALDALEKKSSVKLPALYRTFMTTYGPSEVGGLFRLAGPGKKLGLNIAANSEILETGRHVVAEELGEPWRERLEGVLVFATTFDGDQMVFEKAAKGEAPVLYLPRHGTPQKLAGGFADFLLRALSKGGPFGKPPNPWEVEPG